MAVKKRTKKFDISNKLAYTLIVILSIALLGIGVVAYNLPPPTNVGHTLNEIAWPTCGSGQVLGVSGGVAVCVTSIDSRFTVNSSGLCYQSPAMCGTSIATACTNTLQISFSTIDICLMSDENLLIDSCVSICNGRGVSCNGDISSCLGGTVSYYVYDEVRCYGGSGSRTAYCYCKSSPSIYTRENPIPAGTRCI